jgi:hypothetical protein
MNRLVALNPGAELNIVDYLSPPGEREFGGLYLDPRSYHDIFLSRKQQKQRIWKRQKLQFWTLDSHSLLVMAGLSHFRDGGTDKGFAKLGRLSQAMPVYNCISALFRIIIFSNTGYIGVLQKGPQGQLND